MLLWVLLPIVLLVVCVDLAFEFRMEKRHPTKFLVAAFFSPFSLTLTAGIPRTFEREVLRRRRALASTRWVEVRNSQIYRFDRNPTLLRRKKVVACPEIVTG